MMWAKLLKWMPTVVDSLPRLVDAAKAAWAAFRHAKDAPQEPKP